MIVQIFFGDYVLSIALTALAIISGLTVKLLMSPLRAGMNQTVIYKGLIGLMLIRRKLLHAFIGIRIWNLMVSSIVMVSGALTFGILPLAWAFLNLGLSFPCFRSFKDVFTSLG
ncbi:hypothetical protein DRO64_04485 [Candidatus Bathyarchaeota archaeon]|nr:MAG: hypothetical protein DRO64_04485 [Candidatus Bathyarchaeota archaeon]